MIGIQLEKHKKISITDSIDEFLNPKLLYIPLINRGNTNVTIFVKKNDYIYKGQVLAKTKGDIAIPILSSVSGIIKGFEMQETTYGIVNCVVIENDFEERVEEQIEVEESINHFTKEEFISRLFDCGIIGLGGGGYPTYQKFKQAIQFKTFIVNAVECEPYLTTDYMTTYTKIEEILECCDAIMDIFSIEECFIVIKVHSDALKERIKSFIGTYPKIKIIEVPDIYPMGWEKSLVRYIKHIDYLKLPTEKEIIVNNISTVYAIYEALKYNKPLIERVITFSGDSIENPRNIKLKLGTKMKDVMPMIKLVEENATILFGGPMMGKLSNENTIITLETTGVLFLKENSIEEREMCIHCGKCVRVCPVKISPVLIFENLKNKKRLSELNTDRCIGCGLCSYICPSKIPVRSYVKKACEVLKEDSNE